MLPRSLAGGGRAVAAAARGQASTCGGLLGVFGKPGPRTDRRSPAAAPASALSARSWRAGRAAVRPGKAPGCARGFRARFLCWQHLSSACSVRALRGGRGKQGANAPRRRGPADCPAVTGARGFLEAVAFFTGTLPGSKSVKAAESWGRRRAPTQAQTAPGSPGRPCLAGAPQNLHTTCHLSSSRPQTVA
ncbi:oxidoreductase-like domain-containing protein 1 isoform X1 [Manis pentadactyla]|uniref:oxidoreductase-like domain-containing protein 1 isoform X1 n=1 Tax=Manis pentadactyla TaxID=143292 RepID=UPI00255CDC07|nr:oxidoreductase-like domain-containing protein 1 isoform X1 [Manis pentadactyla]